MEIPKKYIKLWLLIMGLAFICFVLFTFPLVSFADEVDSPYNVEPSVRNAWNNGTVKYGSKDHSWTSGTRLVYDIYYAKYAENGWQIVDRTFEKGNEKFLSMHGWAVLSGYKRHSPTNHTTHIALRKVKGDKDLNTTKIYRTDGLERNATKDLEYNSQTSDPTQLWNECTANATNRINTDCNMRYEQVNFRISLPLEELFPDPYEEVEYELYLIKRVDSQIVYSPLITPFEFNNHKFKDGTISFSSGVDARNLRMNSSGVIRRTYPKQTAAEAPNIYFTQNRTYKNIDMNEDDTAIWYGVTTPEDGNGKRWANTTYWTFEGKEANLSYTPPPYKASINITGNSNSCVNEKVPLKARVVTGDGKTLNLSSDSKLTWASSKTDVASVNSKGEITAKKAGTTVITAKYVDNATKTNVSVNFNFSVSGGCSSEPPDLPNSCPYDISNPSNGQSLNSEKMKPTPTGKISAKGEFDLLQGIPTSEFLKVDSLTDEYLYNQKFQQKTGKVSFKVDIVQGYELKWTETIEVNDQYGNPTTITENRSRIAYVQKNYPIERAYTYWQIEALEIFKLTNSQFKNYALPDELVKVPYDKNVDADSKHSSDVKMHVTPADCKPEELKIKTINAGNSEPTIPDEDLKPAAEKNVGKNKVKNDKVTFQGVTVMNDATVDEIGPTPASIPNPRMVALEKDELQISNTKLNRDKAQSTGLVLYDEILNVNAQGGEKEFPMQLNHVTVHTPVVIYSEVSDDKTHNQRTKPDNSRKAVILDRPFTIQMPTYGAHLNIPGYGTRDYAKYTNKKEVRFPFDVYRSSNGAKTTFIPANTWVDIPVSETETAFYLPVWVNEGNYEVLYRTIAINSPASNFTTEGNANRNLQNHVATDIVPVNVIGRLYDFRISDIADFAWESVFRSRKNDPRHTGNYYWVGDKGIDGAMRGNSAPYMLPIMPGKNPYFSNVSVKTGYHFKFDLKTKGNMFSEGDGIRITPTFFFIDKSGKNRTEVDLYYSTKDKPFIKVGSAEDTLKRTVTLDDRLRNVPQSSIIQTADFAFDNYSNVNTTVKNRFIQQYLKEAKQETWIGSLDWMVLPYKLKTHIGPTDISNSSSVSSLRASASIQQWHGEYSLPADVKVVKKGIDLAEYGRKNRITSHSPIYLSDGYIVVNFNIETIRNQDLSNPHLQYINAPLRNQWRSEGYSKKVNDSENNQFDLLDGDVVFYHADQSSHDDFISNVTR
ncbi:DUF5704 domain-containing protein [Cytobacillus purgationiresistens]|uniref:DUF5704 domain-containing protein n=1 Tax=Cytobacillus purgationiresistens TaxID=863449 RepID=A0ABU0AKC3_9BACI|nr:DUF5704 domain-containing protein [Cytobacillus purgationiresistens]MDQ0271222.1 hypothetical protein [Cytobacillus purgationiresistens]